MLAELSAAPAQVPRKENRCIKLPLYSRWESAIDDLTAALDITQEDVCFMEAKSTFVQLLRTLPSNSPAVRKPLNLTKVADTAAKMRDMGMFRKGMRALELLEQLRDLGVATAEDGYALLREEVEQELVHLGSLKEKVIEEIKKLEEVFKTIRDHNSYLVGQLETYKSYLHNVRSQSEGKQRKQQKMTVLGPYKFSHLQLEKEGVIQKSNVPDNRLVFFSDVSGKGLHWLMLEYRRANIFFNITSPMPGTFVISLHYKGNQTNPIHGIHSFTNSSYRTKSGAVGT